MATSFEKDPEKPAETAVTLPVEPPVELPVEPPVETAPEVPAGTPALRVSDADRERFAIILREAFAEGRLTPDEHDERVDAVLAAKTLGDLVPLIADLPAGQPQRGAGAVPQVPAGPAPVYPGTMVAIFGGSSRSGRWAVGDSLNAFAVMGGVDIDLSEAVFHAPELTIHIVALMGGVDIRVPVGVNVRNQGFGVMGAFDVREQHTGDPNAPTVIIKGLALMGGVTVRPKKNKKKLLEKLLDGDINRPK